MECPMMSKGPALNPLLADSEIVTVSKGPGDKAPDKATPNEATKINTICKGTLLAVLIAGVRCVRIEKPQWPFLF